MLVISRKVHERFTVTSPSGDAIEVAIVSIEGGKVRVGIQAPRSYKILRDDAKSVADDVLGAAGIARADERRVVAEREKGE
jgi:carbon storage regulator CsrA